MRRTVMGVKTCLLQVYTPEDWQLARSWRRHLPTPALSVRVLAGFAAPVFWCTLCAVCICLYHTWLAHEGAPQFWQTGTGDSFIEPYAKAFRHRRVDWTLCAGYWEAFSIASFALSLLLVKSIAGHQSNNTSPTCCFSSNYNLCRCSAQIAATPGMRPVSCHTFRILFT